MTPNTIFVKPTPGRLVRWPDAAPAGRKRKPLKIEGEFVPRSPYWLKRLGTGDCSKATPPAKLAKAEEARRLAVAELEAAPERGTRYTDAASRLTELVAAARAAVGNYGNAKAAAAKLKARALEEGATDLEATVAAADLMHEAALAARADTEAAEKAAEGVLEALGEAEGKELVGELKKINKLDSTAKGRVTRARKALEELEAKLEEAKAAESTNEGDSGEIPPPPEPEAAGGGGDDGDE